MKPEFSDQMWLLFLYSFRPITREIEVDIPNEVIPAVETCIKIAQEQSEELAYAALSIHLLYTYGLFCMAILGIIICHNSLIQVLLFLEIGMLSIGLHFIYASHYWFEPVGQIAAIIIFVIAGVESAVGLSLFLAYSRINGRLDFSVLKILKG
jgi:NADH:ubiquinone oxidoreductase subunit K